MNTAEAFEKGLFVLPERTVDFSQLRWNDHPAFSGVALKHLITGKDTDGTFSYHLVRIAPGCRIGTHIHETQLETHEVIAGGGECITAGTELVYEPGTISILPAGVEHEVIAGEAGLYLFAKFFPALC